MKLRSGLHDAPAFVFRLPLMSRALGATVLLFAALQVWRPYYFLTDDNLSAGLPILTEMGRDLKSGHLPFHSAYLFGGNYDLLGDANYFMWSPVNFLVSLLADTPARFALCDAEALIFLLAGVAGFLILARALRADLRLPLSDGRILFLTLSATFSTFILTVGASWLNFLPNQAALPWLALGLWERRPLRSLLILVPTLLMEAVTGFAAGVVSNLLFLSCFAVLVALHRRQVRPLVLWLAANLATLVVLLPLLLPMLAGFSHSPRGQGMTPELLGRFSMPTALFPFSLLLGNVFEMAARFNGLNDSALFMFPRLATLSACAAAWCLFPVLCQRRKWSPLETGCGLILLLIALTVIRPVPITALMIHFPFLRSMRWPFRELLQWLFFFHLLLILRPWAGTAASQKRVACFSAALFVVPLIFTQPLTFNRLLEDRAAILSGHADRFWAAMRSTQLRPGDRIATVADPQAWVAASCDFSYALAGTADFPAYFRVRTISGYSQTAPLDRLPVPIAAFYSFGTYSPSQVPAVLRAAPGVRLITITHFHPLGLSLSPLTAGAPPIDITPLLESTR